MHPIRFQQTNSFVYFFVDLYQNYRFTYLNLNRYVNAKIVKRHIF